jgi:hypothetical protein
MPDRLKDMIAAAVEKKPLDFSQSMSDVMVDKINELVANRKVELAAEMLNASVLGGDDDEDDVDDTTDDSEEDCDDDLPVDDDSVDTWEDDDVDDVDVAVDDGGDEIPDDTAD